jgi:hypothetical protein
VRPSPSSRQLLVIRDLLLIHPQLPRLLLDDAADTSHRFHLKKRARVPPISTIDDELSVVEGREKIYVSLTSQQKQKQKQHKEEAVGNDKWQLFEQEYWRRRGGHVVVTDDYLSMIDMDISRGLLEGREKVPAALAPSLQYQQQEQQNEEEIGDDQDDPWQRFEQEYWRRRGDYVYATVSMIDVDISSGVSEGREINNYSTSYSKREKKKKKKKRAALRRGLLWLRKQVRARTGM